MAVNVFTFHCKAKQANRYSNKFPKNLSPSVINKYSPREHSQQSRVVHEASVRETVTFLPF